MGKVKAETDMEMEMEFENQSPRWMVQRDVRTVMMNQILQNSQLVAQHIQLSRHINAMLGSEQHGKPRLYMGLLIKQLADGNIEAGRKFCASARHGNGFIPKV